MKLKDLKLCPFCGTTPTVGSLGGDCENWSIYCANCGIPCVENDIDETLDDITKKWNTRADNMPSERWCHMCDYWRAQGKLICQKCRTIL